MARSPAVTKIVGLPSFWPDATTAATSITTPELLRTWATRLRDHRGSGGSSRSFDSFKLLAS